MSFDTAAAAFVPSSAGVPSGAATVVSTTPDTAVFSFYDENQLDAIVKVLDGCPINERFWVFGAAATDSRVELTVTDTATGASRVYENDGGSAFAPIADTGAFQACDAMPAAQPAADISAHGGEGGGRGAPSCDFTFCFQSNRYGLEIAFETFQGMMGSARAADTRDRSGVGWFFHSDNLELVASVLDGRVDNQAFWFLASPITNVRLTYTLTDTETGRVNVYVDPLGPPVLTLLDRGQPVQAGLRTVQAGDPVGLELVLANTAPAERAFRTSLPTIAGLSNPSFTCAGSAGATCPAGSGSGAFDESGSIAPGGVLTYLILFDRAPTRGAEGSIQAEATVETRAHALSEARSLMVAVYLPPPPTPPQPIPVGSPWMLFWLLILVALTAGVAMRRSGAV